MPQGKTRTQRDQRGVTADVGKNNEIEVDWPRSIGFFGALGVATALNLVPLPIAVFVGAVPFLKLLDDPKSSTPRRFFTHLVDGAAKPVGGDSEGTVRWARSKGTAKPPHARAKGRRK